MTIKCNELDNLLLEGDSQSLAIAAEHATACDACMQVLATWNEISATAQSMQTTWSNDTLWPRIARAIEREKRSRWSAVWQIAAAIVIFAAIATIAWRAQRRNEYDKHILQIEALNDVERAEEAHIAAIDHLEKVAESRLDNPATPLMVSYKEKLMLLDDAIAECQTNIERNRSNAQLRSQLLAVYSEKQKTLQDVLREGTHANP
jgi:hypothetical protein